jgi:serine/threonine protein kinase
MGLCCFKQTKKVDDPNIDYSVLHETDIISTISNKKSSSIYKCSLRDNNIAIKVYTNIQKGNKEYDNYMSLGNSDYTINIYDSFNKVIYGIDSFVIVMELGVTDLFNWTTDNYMHYKKIFNQNQFEKLIIDIVLKIAYCIQYIHKTHAHLDLKLENVIVMDDDINNFHVKLADMEYLTNKPLSDLRCGSPSYVAPEIISNKFYIPIKADIYSFGIMIYMMLHFNFPFDDDNIETLFISKINNNIQYDKNISTDLILLLINMLDIDPNKRYNINTIIKKLKSLLI